MNGIDRMAFLSCQSRFSLDKERPRRRRVAGELDGVACWRSAAHAGMGGPEGVSAGRVPDPGPSGGEPGGAAGGGVPSGGTPTAVALGLPRGAPARRSAAAPRPVCALDRGYDPDAPATVVRVHLGRLPRRATPPARIGGELPADPADLRRDCILRSTVEHGLRSLTPALGRTPFAPATPRPPIAGPACSSSRSGSPGSPNPRSPTGASPGNGPSRRPG